MAESMKDFETELEQSFQVIKEGDVLEVEVIGISETELTVDLNYYTEGIIPLEECSDDPAFSIKNDCNIGDRIQAMVIDAENENGVVILSKKAAHNLMIWDELEEDYQNRTVFQVKITDTTSGGIIGYVKGVRAFIPASKIELNYVEDTSGYLGMTLEAMIITVDKEAKRLVLSAKEIQKERKAKEYVQKVGQLTVGDVVTGTVDRIESYGVFITIGEDLTGLCHISQITNKFIKSPKEIVKLGDTLPDMGGLHRKIFVVVKSYFHRSFPLWWPGTPYPGFKITNISIPQPVVGCNAKQSAERNSGRIGRFGRYIVLFFVKMVPVQNAKGTAAVCGSPLCSYEELSVWRKKMACYFASAGWVFLTRLRITAPSTLPTASATQYLSLIHI